MKFSFRFSPAQLHPVVVWKNSSEKPMIPPGATDCSLTSAVPVASTSVVSDTNFIWKGLSSAKMKKLSLKSLKHSNRLYNHEKV